MKVSIIGGSGFVGSRLIGLLKEQPGIELINIDKEMSRYYPEITNIANVLDLDSLTELLKGSDMVLLLAAEHRDDISPVSLYYDVNVKGAENTLRAMERNGISRLLFTSSVAVYGLNKSDPAESASLDPFNDYGKSKLMAEDIFRKWHNSHPDWNIEIVRPTVIFGEGNRGNVYNLLRQIASGRFMMIGKGDNRKSMAYVGNVAAFIAFLVGRKTEAYEVYNYVDKPDFTTNELVNFTGKILQRHIPAFRIPYGIGLFGGYCFDLLAKIVGKKLPISSVRVKKFAATSGFNSSKALSMGFTPPFSLEEGLKRTLEYEFGNKQEK